MLAVILEFDVIEGMEEEFRIAWIETTELIYQHFGSLGSRLHKAENGKFIAYAQWPSLDIYESEHNWPVNCAHSRERMRATLKIGKPTLLHKLTLDTDLLKGLV
ncbi:antibiotic biosynthesis monooxygenase family protein [Psychromonas sp. KJ10-2]|uniref:antibiotic biosynthesis monooxygenase family protein n=1 Tax=Psychromonas sp. KJ10-2 TaxID=3391822 RepID=UPI0039B4A1F1